ncbi:MAG TPA: hypothetical protein DEP84_36265 [Chloroflexi bacterium]|nr:hypothetical protein [Chloroflexota bacterium]
MDREELLKQMHAGRERLNEALGRVDESRMTVPVLPNDWSVKDLVAHIGWWEQRITGLYTVLSRGELPGADNDMPVDALNARVYAENRDRSLAEVVRDERDAYQALLWLAESAPDDDLFNPDRFAWTEGEPFVRWIISNTYGHYDEHLPDLLVWLNT